MVFRPEEEAEENPRLLDDPTASKARKQAFYIIKTLGFGASFESWGNHQ